MDKLELRRRLNQHRVRPDHYSLDGRLKNDAFILEETHGKWTVFYFERGDRYDERVFDSEERACGYIYGMLKDEPSVKR